MFHLCFGFASAFFLPITLAEAANTVLLPLVGILIGLSFAWAGNAQALLQASEIEEMTQHHPGGFAEYVFTFQTAILAIFITLVVWALAGLKLFDSVWPIARCGTAYFLIAMSLYTLSSLTLRECWHVVLGAQWMLMAQHEIKMKRRADSENSSKKP